MLKTHKNWIHLGREKERIFVQILTKIKRKRMRDFREREKGDNNSKIDDFFVQNSNL